MARAFFIVGPTATGKSELAADLAAESGGEVVGADAFQLYRGLDLLSAKPEVSILAKVPHHLISTIPLSEEMNAEKYRRAATHVINEINLRGKIAIVGGGSGLYIKSLTHGLARLPESDPKLREKLNSLESDELRAQLAELDPETAGKIDIKNRHRLVRALEICLLTGRPTSAQRKQWGAHASIAQRSASCRTETRRQDADVSTQDACATGIFVFRDREELYQRINRRVETMFERGVIDEVRAAGSMSSTAAQMIGLREIRDLIAGKKTVTQCIAEIQQATRRYAKRQLTWFRRQSNFFSLNLSFITHNEAVNWISLRMLPETGQRDD
ncbi:MAG TPA: tRNA (adenosine(37)-N6)-dimethylallyltransferase MiaA [Candidatus Udaeobacter sp.]|jgi:tRNA dimethylallyltransferase|nr:tRNA (adenosine(37)-N6)-dimethylallyltransferase MiaA [Candidatus Udaeobacter sp.]